MARPGHELPLLLFGGFRAIVDEAHRRLADAGHGEVRPAYGFAMQAIGQGASVGEIARALGVSKQAAAKSVDRLSALGYVTSSVDSDDARRKVVAPTRRGNELLALSAEVFEDIYAEWGSVVGRRRLNAMHDDLATLAGEQSRRLDGFGWLG